MASKAINQLSNGKLPGMFTFFNCMVAVFTLPLYVLAAYSYFHKDLARKLFLNTSYYLVTALVFLWVWSLIKYLKAECFDPKKFLIKHGAGLLAALLLTGTISISVKPSMRVLSDETNIASVARSMLYYKTVENVTEGYYYYNNFHLPEKRQPVIEKRPFLLPYLIHALHAVLGYHVRNTYFANQIFLFLTFFCVYLFLARYLERLWVFSAMVCVAAQPLVSLCAMSGGYDLCGAFCLIVCFISLQNWLEDTKALHRLEFFWVSLIALAQSRPESLIFTVTLVFLLIGFGYFRKEFIEAKFWLCALSPVLLLSVLWQRLLIVNQYENPKGVVPFSFANFIQNNITFIKTLNRFDFYLPYATVLNIIGLAGLIYGAGLILFPTRQRRIFFQNKPLRDFSILSVLILAEQWAIYMFYYFGNSIHPSSARYFTLTCILLSMSAVALVRHLAEAKHAVLFFIIACSVYILYNPVSMENRFSNTQTLPRQYVYLVDYFQKHASKNSLIITSRPGQHIIYDSGAVGFDYANLNKKSVLTGFYRHLFEEIYVVQDISYRTNEPEPNQQLSSDYVLKTVSVLQNTAAVYTRISKVINVPQPESPAVKKGTPEEFVIKMNAAETKNIPVIPKKT